MAMTHRSILLQERFAKCFPPHCTHHNKIAFFHVYYLLILPSYGKMKSDDTLHVLRDVTKKGPDADENFPTRLKAVNRHKAAKGSG
jgi:hypothetical protein